MRVMILAAGRGERMRPLSDQIPKGLLPVGGKPLIEWHLEKLARAGCRDVVINHAWLGEQIERRMGDGTRFGLRIRYSAEGTALNTAGGIAAALPLLGSEPFLVVNSDIYTTLDYAALIERRPALPAGVLAHLVLVDNPAHNARGDFALVAGEVRETGEPLLTFAGVGIYEPTLFSQIVPQTRAPLAPLLRTAMRERQVSGEHFTGLWMDVGTPERLVEVDALVYKLQRGGDHAVPA